MTFKKLTKKTILAILALLVIGIPFLYLTILNSKPVAAWFNESWLYRKAITITVASNASDITDLETLITVDTSASGKFQSSCQDLRFTNVSGKLLPFYIDSGCGTSSTKVWVMVDLVPKNTTTYTMYMYYGNPSAPAVSDSNKFRLFNGLVGYWTMNESSWTNDCSTETVIDSSINANNGKSCPNADGTQPTTGKYSNAGSFDGSNDSVNIGDPADGSLDFGTGAFSISFWYQRDVNATTNLRVISKGGDSNTTGGWGLYGSDTGLTVLIGDGTPRNGTSASGLTTGVWYHAVATRSGGNVNLYINGVLTGSITNGVTGSVSNSHPFTIGALYGPQLYFPGKIDDVRVYNKALSASEVSQLYSKPGTIASSATTTAKPSISIASEEQGPGPVGYWSFNDGQGTTAQDSSSSNNDGTITGATWQTEDQCVVGKCLWFDGAARPDADFVSTSTYMNGIFTGTSPRTFSAWIKTDLSQSGAIMAKNDSQGAGIFSWTFRVNTAGKLTFQLQSGSSDYWNHASGNTIITANKWHFVTAVVTAFSPANIDIYVDGKEVASTYASGGSVPTSWGSTNTPVWIGKEEFAASTYAYKGFIDEVKIYPYARTVAQIKTDYLSGKASAESKSGVSSALGANPQIFMSDGLVGYWKMDEVSWAGAAGEVIDSSGNSNNGTAYGGATTTVGKYGNGGDFSGTGDYVRVSDNSNLRNNGDFSIAFWYKMSAMNGTYPIILTKGGGTPSNGYQIFYTSDGTLYYKRDDAYTSVATAITTNWRHFVLTYQGGSWVWYVDGTKSASGTRVFDTNNSSANLDFDSSNNAGKGYLDGIRFYTRTLSSKEVSDLYNFAPGPVGYWKMDDKVKGASQTIVDTSGTGNNGTTYSANGTGMDCTVVGKYGGGCNLDGTDDYVSGSSTGFPSGTAARTVTLWAKPSVDTGNYQIAFNYGPITSTNGWGIGIDISTDKWYVSQIGSSVAGNVANWGQWTFIAATMDGSGNYVLYENGVQVNTGTMTTSTTLSNFTIGQHSSNYWFNGQIDDVKIYNYARTQKQIVEDMNASHPSVGSPIGSAVGYWKFDEGQGTVVNNSGNGGSTLNGTLTSMSSPATATSGWTQAGKFGKGLLFDGSDDYVSVTDNTALDLTTGITISAWVKPTVVNITQDFITKHNSATTKSGYALLAVNDVLYCQTGDGTTWANGNAQSGSILTAGSWQHLICTFDGSTLRLYRNGVLVASDTTVNTIFANTQNLWIGADVNTPGSYEANGSIDEVKIYNYALTSDEVKLDYNRGSSMVLGAAGNNSTYAPQAANQEYCVPGDATSCVAPIARWDFEDTSQGSSVQDTSGNANTGTWNGTGTKHWDTGKVGKAGKFNGTDDYVNVTASSSLAIGGALTTSAWIKVSDFSDNWGIAGKWGGLDTYRSWQLAARTTQVFGVCLDDGTQYCWDTTTTFSPNIWYHITLSYNTSTVKLYVNGQEQTLTQIAGSGVPASIQSLNTRRTLIGAWDNYVGGSEQIYKSFKGQIDQVRIFNYARTPAQIAWDYNRGGPVGHWKFDECQGTITYDSSGNSNNGTITIGATGTQDGIGTCTDGDATNTRYNGVTGKRNYSLNFDGTDDYVTITDAASLSPANAITVATWIKGSAQQGKGIVSHYDYGNGQRAWNLRTGDTNTKFIAQMSDDGTYDADHRKAYESSITVMDNSWHHVAFTFNSGTLKLYVDGKEDTNPTKLLDDAITTLHDSTANLSLGAYYNNGSLVNYFTGQIDDTRVYNYDLTPAQVKDIYNGGAINYGPSTGAP